MLTELALLETIAGAIADPSVLADDAYHDAATGQLLTTDLLVEGRHFHRAYCTPEDIGWKAVAVNVSDIAAMGGRPEYLLISLGLPAPVAAGDFVPALYAGLQAAASAFGAKIVGGDTVGADIIVLNVAATGRLPEGNTLGKRSAARIGDVVFTTGYSGLSAWGLKVLQQGLPGFPASRQAHLRPLPRLAEAAALAANCPRYALMDTSDGLADACLKVAHASGVALELDAAALPVHPELAQALSPDAVLEALLYGGEDFQLLGSAPAENVRALPGLTPIGRVVAAETPGAWLRLADGSTAVLSLEGTYRHF